VWHSSLEVRLTSVLASFTRSGSLPRASRSASIPSRQWRVRVAPRTNQLRGAQISAHNSPVEGEMNRRAGKGPTADEMTNTPGLRLCVQRRREPSATWIGAKASGALSYRP
jgi:hypothetical protein